MTGFDCYRTYLAFKNHFTKDNFDYFKYGGKTNATTSSFNKRKDKYFFEKMSRQKKDEDIVDYFTAIFSQCDDPQRVWIGEIIETGEDKYNDWKKKIQSLNYLFKQEMMQFFDSEMVQTSLEEIKELQDLITNSIIDTAFSPVTGFEEDESEQLDLIEELLEKQKLMYFRCKLSKDEDAMLVAENMRESLRQMGMPRGATVEQMFDNLKGSIRKLRETLDN